MSIGIDDIPGVLLESLVISPLCSPRRARGLGVWKRIEETLSETMPERKLHRRAGKYCATEYVKHSGYVPEPSL